MENSLAYYKYIIGKTNLINKVIFQNMEHYRPTHGLYVTTLKQLSEIYPPLGITRFVGYYYSDFICIISNLINSA